MGSPQSRVGAQALFSSGAVDTMMHKKILIPSDGSELSLKAIEHGVALAREMNAAIVFVTVTNPFHSTEHEPRLVVDMPEEYKRFVHDYLTADSNSYLEAAKAVAAKAGVACEAFHVQHNHIYQGIIDTAGSTNCDLIIMASHGRRGVSAIILGSETSKVLTHDQPHLIGPV